MRIPGSWSASQYLPALRARGRSVPYDPARSWTTRYELVLADGELDDASTIGSGISAPRVRYHYNAVENAILEHALRAGLPESPTVLDVGSGAGHWIDFYRDVFSAAEVVGIEISGPAAASLGDTYADVPEVTILEADAADAAFDLGRTFDVVNAVDVLFHVVDDDSWRRAVRNLAAHLRPGGRMVVAEYVALVTHDAGFRRPSTIRGEDPGRADVIVTKRVRSPRRWRECAREAGLTVVESVKIRKAHSLQTPANRLLVLAHAAHA
jgi:SAM-dependent methyltransferase